MMSLDSLPIEILIIIIQKLDTKSIYNLYRTNEFFKNVVRTPRVVKRCRFSLSTLSTVNSLNLDFLRDLSGHLTALDLSGIDLTITPVLVALEKLRVLDNLDVTYTNITMIYFLDIMTVRPTLRSLAINFTFDEEKYRFTTQQLLRYQEVCSVLENVHFVGSMSSLLYGEEASFMLSQANLRRYMVTIYGRDCVYTHDGFWERRDNIEWKTTEIWGNFDMMSKVAYFNAFFVQDRLQYCLFQLPTLRKVDLNKCECIYLQRNATITVYASPLMKQFIKDHFETDVMAICEMLHPVIGEIHVMLWNKELNQFDYNFFLNLFYILNDYLKYTVDPSGLIPVPLKYKWYHMLVDPDNGENSESNFELKFNNDLAQKEDIKLLILFKPRFTKPIITYNCDVFKNLTYLSLFGNVEYNPEFFENLFVNVHSLSTLIIIKTKDEFPFLWLQHLSRCISLKNIQLYLPEIYFFPYFEFFSRCPNLENIHLTTMGFKIHPVPHPENLFRNCTKLYNIFLKADLIDIELILQVFNSTKNKLNMDYLNIDIVPFTGNASYVGGVIASVFRMNELKPYNQWV